MAEAEEGGGGRIWSGSSADSSPGRRRRRSPGPADSKVKAKKKLDMHDTHEPVSSAKAGARAQCTRRHCRQAAASPGLGRDGSGDGGGDGTRLSLKGAFTRGENSPQWEEAAVVFSPRGAARSSKKSLCI